MARAAAGSSALHASDLAMLEALDWHPQVRSAMLAGAERDPKTAAAAQRAVRAAAEASQEDDQRRAAIKASQATVWFNRATLRPQLIDETLDDESEAALPEPRKPQEARSRRPLARAATAFQPCLLGSPPIALPPLRFLDESESIGQTSSDRRRPHVMLHRARSMQQLELEQQRRQQPAGEAPPASAASRPVTAAAARRLHARTALYLSR